MRGCLWHCNASGKLVFGRSSTILGKSRLQENDIFNGEFFYCFSHSCDFQLKKIIKSFFFRRVCHPYTALLTICFLFWKTSKRARLKLEEGQTGCRLQSYKLSTKTTTKPNCPTSRRQNLYSPLFSFSDQELAIMNGTSTF